MTWHWRDSMRSPRFFMFDARAALPILLVVMHARLWTLILAVGCIVIFYVLERFGLTFEAALRRLRCKIIGKKRPAYSSQRYRRFTDAGW